MLVPAWDTRTGEKLPNDVPKHWLEAKVFPHLVGSQAAATKALAAQVDPDGVSAAQVDPDGVSGGEGETVVIEPGDAPTTTGRKIRTPKEV